jgi:hypothetical protein
MNPGSAFANIAVQGDGAAVHLDIQARASANPALVAQNQEATPNEHDVLFGRGGK